VTASKETFLEHLKSLRKAVLSAGAELLVAGDSLQALVRLGRRQLVLHPQFLTTVGDRAHRTPELHDGSDGFAGWRPYVSRTWSLATDRAAFRRTVRAAGLAAPELLEEAPAPGTAVIVSSLSASAGRRVEGPFRPATERPLDPARGEAYEPFVRGDLLEVWIWNGAPICAELERPPRVTGDGRSTVTELIARAAALAGIPDPERELLLSRCERLLRVDRLAPSTVPPAGAAQLVGVGYGSSPVHGGRAPVDLAAGEGPEWLAPLSRAAQALHAAMPEAIRADTLFSVEAILDEAGRPWLLDLDCNPAVPPLAYAAMMRTLLAPGRGAADAAAADAATPRAGVSLPAPRA